MVPVGGAKMSDWEWGMLTNMTRMSLKGGVDSVAL